MRTHALAGRNPDWVASDGSGKVYEAASWPLPGEVFSGPVMPGLPEFRPVRSAPQDLTAELLERVKAGGVVSFAEQILVDGHDQAQRRAARVRVLDRKPAIDRAKVARFEEVRPSGRALWKDGRAVRVFRDSAPDLPAAEVPQDSTREELEERQARQDSRRLKYKLQRMAAKLQPGERVALCHRLPSSAGGVQIKRLEGRAFYAGFQTCGSVWMCPVCAAKVTEARRQELQQLVDLHRAQGGHLLFLTLTIPHRAHDVLTAPASQLVKITDRVRICKETGEVIDLETAQRTGRPVGVQFEETGEVVELEREEIRRVNGGRLVLDEHGELTEEASGIVPRLTSAYRRFMSGRGALSQLLDGQEGRAGYLGSVRALEVTHGRNNGYHPHLHVLILVDRPFTFCEVMKLQRQLFKKWQKAVRAEKLGEIAEFGLKLEVPDVAGDLDPVTQYVIKWGAAEELSKLHTKKAGASMHDPKQKKGLSPWELLDAAAEGDVRAAGIWKEYAAAFKGRRQLVYSHGLRRRFGLGPEKTDEQLAEQPEPMEERQELVHQVTRPQLVALRAVGDRATALDLAEYGTDQVVRYLEACVTEYVAKYGPLPEVIRPEDSIVEAACFREEG